MWLMKFIEISAVVDLICLISIVALIIKNRSLEKRIK